MIDLINRWKKFEGAKGRRPAMAMQDHYSDIEIMIPELVKFSSSLSVPWVRVWQEKARPRGGRDLQDPVFVFLI